MDLLNFARGPALSFALVVFVLGTLWRLGGILRRPRMRDLSPPRPGAPSNLMDELIASQQIRVNKIGESVTFHDPCQIVRRGGLESAARRVLVALGLELIELKDHGVTGYCCGGGGGVVSNQRATPLRHKVFEMKKQQVEATGAQRFVTSCGQCRIALEMGAKHAHWDKPAESLLELVADNLAD